MKRWFTIALGNLLVAGIMGLLLRIMFLTELPFVRFRPWLHGHSHSALLGWLFMGTVLVLLHDGGQGRLSRGARFLLIGLQAAVAAMLVCFPMQGYGAVSLSAATLHVLLSYALLAHLWYRSLAWPRYGSRLLTRTAILMFVGSTLGLLSIGPIIASSNQGQEIYYWAVQFFLHFQFNGWFWFAAMAIGARWAERNGFDLQIDRLTIALWVVSAILTYALAIAWSEPLPAVFATISAAVALQVWVAWRTLRILMRLHARAHERFLPWTRILIGIALVCMAMKVLVQAGVAVPAVAVMAFTLRSYVIGFIHMNTLGVMTVLLLAYAIHYQWLRMGHWASRPGLILLTAGIISSELLLFTQGSFFWLGWGLIPGHYWHMVIASALMPLATLLLLIALPAGRTDRTVDRI